MAHIASQSAVNAESQAVSSDSSHDIGDSESAKEGTCIANTGSYYISGSALNIVPAKGNSEVLSRGALWDCAIGGSFEDTSCTVKKKKMYKCRKENRVSRDKGSECHGTVKEGASEADAVSAASDVLVEGNVADNLATSMERVNTDSTLYGRPSSPYVSSENDWEASDPSSDSDADHSDSSDDDNPKSQVDRWIDCEAIQFMDGENSNLSSETDDTDDDSDSDITDVSPLVSTGTSPLFGLSPAVSRRNLPSSFSNRQPFMRHYSHRGHDGDVEDEEEDDHHDFNKWSDDLLNNHHSSEDLFVSDHHHAYGNDGLDHKSNMSLVVQALLKLNLERAGTDNEHVDCTNQNKNDHQNNLSHLIRRHSHNHMSPALQANPHHRHLRKHSHPRRKNMSFTNEEVRIINRDNSIMLDKLLAVHNRPERTHNNTTIKHLNKPAPATVNRKKQEEGIRKENIAILRRLQEVKPSRAVSSSRNSRHNHHSHHHHARSCSATARQANHHHHHHHHHTPKETAL